MASLEHLDSLEASQIHVTIELPTTTAACRCLFIPEILLLVFDSIWLWDGDSRKGHADEDEVGLDVGIGKKTLASLARTCRSFSGAALDVLWRVLDSLDSLFAICPKPEASTDEIDWSSFLQYAGRVRSIQVQGHNTQVPALVRQTLTASLERYPSDRGPIFPNLTELHWKETAILRLDETGVPLFKYFTGPALTTLALSFLHSPVPPAPDLAILSDLSNLCPNVTSFTVFFSYGGIYDLSRRIGEMTSRWRGLRDLRSCAIPQSDMDKLASRRTLETLGIEITALSPVYVGRVPDTVQELLLSARDTALCVRYLQNVHGSPTICRLFIGMDQINEAENEALFQLLPLRLDTSRLEHLAIQPRSVLVKTRLHLSEMPKLKTSFVQMLSQFTFLRELDMDLFCTSQLDDAEYAQMAKLLPQLRHLKIGTAKLSSVVRPYPVATVIAVTTVLTYCPHLETLWMPFDGRILPPSSLTESAFGSKGLCQERLGNHNTATSFGVVGVPNKRITELHVGCSPIADDTISVLASCLKSLMPHLKQIQHHSLDERWNAVQSMLTS